MIDVIEKSGPVFYALALCSLIATVVIIERLLSLRRSRVLPRQILDVVDVIERGKDLGVALEICRRNPGVLANVMRAVARSSYPPSTEIPIACTSTTVDRASESTMSRS